MSGPLRDVMANPHDTAWRPVLQAVFLDYAFINSWGE